MLQKCFQFRLDSFSRVTMSVKNALSFSEKKEWKWNVLLFISKENLRQTNYFNPNPLPNIIHNQILYRQPVSFQILTTIISINISYIYIENYPFTYKASLQCKITIYLGWTKKKFPRQFSFYFLQALSPSVAFKFGTPVFIAHIFGLIAWWLRPWTFSWRYFWKL